MSTVLLGEPDSEFDRGFLLGACWQRLRAGLDHVELAVPQALTERVIRMGSAAGYRAVVRKTTAGTRFLRFTSTR